MLPASLHSFTPLPDKGDYDAKLRQLMLPDSQMDSEKVHLHTNIGHILYYLTLAMIK
jgi:hypothetical protein